MDNLKSLARNAAKKRDATEAVAKGIIEARVDGFPWGKIAEAVGITRQGVEKIAKRANGGVLPRPRQNL